MVDRVSTRFRRISYGKWWRIYGPISAERQPIDSSRDAQHIGFWVGDDQVKRSAANWWQIWQFSAIFWDRSMLSAPSAAVKRAIDWHSSDKSERWVEVPWWAWADAEWNRNPHAEGILPIGCGRRRSTWRFANQKPTGDVLFSQLSGFDVAKISQTCVVPNSSGVSSAPSKLIEYPPGGFHTWICEYSFHLSPTGGLFTNEFNKLTHHSIALKTLYL